MDFQITQKPIKNPSEMPSARWNRFKDLPACKFARKFVKEHPETLAYVGLVAATQTLLHFTEPPFTERSFDLHMKTHFAEIMVLFNGLVAISREFVRPKVHGVAKAVCAAISAAGLLIGAADIFLFDNVRGMMASVVLTFISGAYMPFKSFRKLFVRESGELPRE
jgi:hypothetical protein